MRREIALLGLIPLLLACSSKEEKRPSSGSSASFLQSVSSNDDSAVAASSDEESAASSEIKPSAGLIESSLTLGNTSEFKESISSKGKGEQKILVIPCHFKGEREFASDDVERIRRAFFDPDLSSSGNYYSLTEFYSASSQGQLNFSGEVTSILEVPYTVKEVEDDGNYFPGVPASVFLSSDVSDDFLASYDLNKDGYIDNAVFVYSTPTSSRSGNFWAWVNTFSSTPNLSRPSFARHMWVGIDNFSEEHYAIDAHTIIHEAGHLLGLRDYYPSDNYNLALGGHSMMDYNISDHDPYSKMLLGWLDPLYYDFSSYNEVTIELPSFQKDNSCLLFKPNWNHSVMDEYLLFEYYTPTGLNELDAATQYANRPLGFNESGIKIYHVDSRIAKCKVDSTGNALAFQEYVNEIPEDVDSSTYYVIGASNSTADSRTDSSRQGRYKQIALVENKQFNKLQSGSPADNDSLFQIGDAFDSSDSAYLLKGAWNDNTKIGLKMEVLAMDINKATIKLTCDGGSL